MNNNQDNYNGSEFDNTAYSNNYMSNNGDPNSYSAVYNDGIKEGGQFFNSTNNQMPNPNPNDLGFSNQDSLQTDLNSYSNDSNSLNGNLNNDLNNNANNNYSSEFFGIENPNNTMNYQTPSKPNNKFDIKTFFTEIINDKNKLVFIAIVIIAILAVGIGTYIILKVTRSAGSRNVDITLNNLEVYVGDTLPGRSSFATVKGMNIENCKFDLSKINTTRAGTYEFTVTCGSVSKTGNVKVLDNHQLENSLVDVIKVKNQKLTVDEFLKSPSPNYTYKFTDKDAVQQDLRNVGEYEVSITATNTENKSFEIKGKLYVVNYEIKGYLTCSNKAQTVPNSSATYVVSNRFGISYNKDQNSNIYSGLGFEIYTFTFSDQVEYSSYVKTYNTSGSVVVNNVTSDNITFDDVNRQISITSKLNNIDLYNKYGENIFNKYSTLRTYYTKTLNNDCTYSKVS